MRRDLEILAATVHGALAFGHALGAVYNYRKGNRNWFLFHSAAAVLDLYATGVHRRAAREA